MISLPEATVMTASGWQREPSKPLMEFPNKVKCVIWDLDDTLWTGTLAEKDLVAPRDEIVGLIPQLDQKGVINTICSKNELAAARECLEKFGVWSYFVFPSIAFVPKGESVKELIQNLQLRPANVLFIDDNPSNRNEVSFYNPDIMVADANDPSLLDNLKKIIASSNGTSRLEQYRLLEQKHQIRASFADNGAFLRDSRIAVNILRNPADLTFKDRIVELVNRANQLNFTHSRFPSMDDFAEYTAQASIVHGCIFAYDRYGDYGLVGFFAFNESNRRRELEHYVFSCRIMNMGIERAVYESLREKFCLQPLAALGREVGEAPVASLRYGLDDRVQEYVKSKMNVPERYRTSIIAGCTAGVIEHYLPEAIKPARHDVFHLSFSESKISDVDAIIYAVYADYSNDAWEKPAFSYRQFRERLRAFLDANRDCSIVLLLASEHPFPHRKRTNVYLRLRGWLSDLYRGKTGHRLLKCNQIVRTISSGLSHVKCMESGAFVVGPGEQVDRRHFDRIVIQRICEALPRVISDLGKIKSAQV
jgi:FkbH-like protein